MLMDFRFSHPKDWAPLSCLIWFVGSVGSQVPVEDLSVLTFNVRYDNPDDTLVWQDRKAEVADAVRFYDVVGLQEVLPHQLADLEAALPHMSHAGQGRDADGGGEACPVFWRTDRFDLLHAETRWLSATPQQPGSIGWDADLPRAATWVLLFDRATGKRIRILNAHWSHVGPTAREASAALSAGWMGSSEEDLVRILMGDFNEEPEGPAVQSLQRLSGLEDAYANPRTRCRRTFGTYTTFFTDRTAGAPRIDYIWVDGAEVKWHCVDEVIKWGVFISDHAPLHAILEVDHWE